jgi:hypothetical protein
MKKKDLNQCKRELYKLTKRLAIWNKLYWITAFNMDVQALINQVATYGSLMRSGQIPEDDWEEMNRLILEKVDGIDGFFGINDLSSDPAIITLRITIKELIWPTAVIGSWDRPNDILAQQIQEWADDFPKKAIKALEQEIKKLEEIIENAKTKTTTP